MTKKVEIVDRGRGPQLSTNRITVQDLVPYFQKQLTCAQILEIMPALSSDEILAVQDYIRENYDAVMEQDRRIRERNAARTKPPEIEEILRSGGEKMAALREQFGQKKHAEKNGDHADG